MKNPRSFWKWFPVSLVPAFFVTPMVFAASPPPTPPASSRVTLEDVERATSLLPPALEVPPQELSRVAPVYPSELKSRGISGRVVVDFKIDAQGNVRNAFAESTTHPEFARAAVLAISASKFKPGTKGGIPGTTRLRESVEFSVDGFKANVSPLKAEQSGATKTVSASDENLILTFDVSQLDVRPVANDRNLPLPPARGLSGNIIVDFIVNEKGKVSDVRLVEGAGSKLGEMAVKAVSRWTFKPGEVNGRAVRTYMVAPIIYDTSGTTAAPTAASALGSLESNGTFEISVLDEKPVATSQGKPRYPVQLRRAGISGGAVVDFIVDTQGNVRNVRAVKFNHESFGQAAVETVSAWKFKPGIKAGKAVNTHMQVPIMFTVNER